jgi:BolA protein
MTTAETIDRLLREALAPHHLEVRDESAQHAGHAGAAAGGGHYRVLVVAEAFEERSLLERHREVNRVLAGLVGGEIHALGLVTRSVSEWTAAGGAEEALP